MSLESFTKVVLNDSPNVKFIHDLLKKVKVSRLHEIFKEIDALSLEDTKGELPEVLDILAMLYSGTTIDIKKDNKPIFRARKHERGVESYLTLKELTYPPKHLIKTTGRLNLPNESVYYAAFNPNIATLETTLDSSAHEPVGFATVVCSALKHNLSWLINLYPEHIDTPIYDDSANALIVGNENRIFLQEELSDELCQKIFLIRKFISNRVIAHRNAKEFNCYNITANFAQILYEKFEVKGIVYPTVAMGHSMSCLALLPEVYDENFIPYKAYRIKYDYVTPISKLSNRRQILCYHLPTHESYKIRKNGRVLWKKIDNQRRTIVTVENGVPKFEKE